MLPAKFNNRGRDGIPETIVITVLVVTIVILALASDRLRFGLSVQRGETSAGAAEPMCSSTRRGCLVTRSSGIAVRRNVGKADDTPETMVSTVPEITMMR